jgi:uncharacterized protein
MFGGSNLDRSMTRAAHVVAVSVARPRWQEMYGRRVFSSIVREPSTAPIRFQPGGVEGHETAVHTEEVFCFFAEHYDMWSQRLGVERAAWGNCHWGENLMLAGMPLEDNLHIGDRFRIGEALLEVTSPRIPCFKLSWRLGQPESFLGDLIKSGRMGCYFRVIDAGAIGPSDTVTRESCAPSAITVMGLSNLLHDPNITDLDVLRRTLATPGLGGQASEMIRKRLNALTDGQLPSRNRWQGWRRFSVTNVKDTARGIKSFHIAPLDGGPIGGYRAGQFLTVRLPERAGSLIRSWSISDYDQEGGSYRLSIKREPNGVASTFMHDRLAVGDILDVRPPSGRFMLDRSGFLRTVMISAGIGVTPLVAMLKAHAERGAEAPPLLWVHAARSGEEHAFSDEVEAALAALPNAVRRIFYSLPGDADLAKLRHDRTGRFRADAIAELLSETYKLAPFGRELELTGDNSDFYLCGPHSFEEMVKQGLTACGVNPALIRSESFRPSGQPRDAIPTPEEASVKFVRSGKCVTWRSDDDLTILELAEKAGIAIENSCRLGTCGSCEIGIARGKVGYVAKPAADPAPGRILACCTQPLTSVVELDA